MISGSADLNRFYRALMQGRLLPAEQLKEMKTTVTDPDHGEELILEIEGHVEIGMTPVDALRAATSEGARNLRIEGITGSVRTGLVADLLVV